MGRGPQALPLVPAENLCSPASALKMPVHAAPPPIDLRFKTIVKDSPNRFSWKCIVKKEVGMGRAEKHNKETSCCTLRISRHFYNSKTFCPPLASSHTALHQVVRVGGKVLVSKWSSKRNDIRTGQDARPRGERGARRGRAGTTHARCACSRRTVLALPLGSYRLGHLPGLSHVWFVFVHSVR